MKHEITTELRNSVVNILVNSVIKATFLEVQDLLGRLQKLPIIEGAEQKDIPVVVGSPGIPEKKKVEDAVVQRATQ